MTLKAFVVFVRMPNSGHGSYLAESRRGGTTGVRKHADRFPSFEAATEKARELNAEASYGERYETRFIEVDA